MLAGSQIEILGNTEKYLAERVGEGTRAVHPSEPRASRRPARAIGGVAKHVKKRLEVELLVMALVNGCYQPTLSRREHYIVNILLTMQSS